MICFVKGDGQALDCVCGHYVRQFELPHGFSYVGFSTGTVASVNNMGWVLVFVLEFENALDFLSLPQDMDL